MNSFLVNPKDSACCGCGACVQACPKKCIKMIENDEGFLYPQVNSSSCVNCGLCSKVCPFENYEKAKNTGEQKYYAAYTHNKDYIINSSSGGLFSEFAAFFASNRNVICGATIDNNHKVFHTIVYSIDEIKSLQGSKYVQSDLKNCMSEIKKLISNGAEVLFVGTPCQVAALKNFISSPKLWTIDVLCHGVPSQKLFDYYISYLEKKT